MLLINYTCIEKHINRTLGNATQQCAVEWGEIERIWVGRWTCWNMWGNKFIRKSIAVFVVLYAFQHFLSVEKNILLHVFVNADYWQWSAVSQYLYEISCEEKESEDLCRFYSIFLVSFSIKLEEIGKLCWNKLKNLNEIKRYDRIKEIDFNWLQSFS